MRLFGVVLMASLALGVAPALAQQGGALSGTPQEQAACRRDSIRFCREVISDSLRVLACLQANRAKISKACQAVLTSHGQ